MNKSILSLAVAGLLASAGAVSAQSTETETIQVTAEVVAACSIDSTATLAFGQYNPVSGEAIDGHTDVGVICTNAHPYSIGLNLGINAEDSERRMVHTGDAEAFLTYELYVDEGRSEVWGDIGPATVGETGNGEAQIHTIRGRIAQQQATAKLGSYADTITITVSY